METVDRDNARIADWVRYLTAILAVTLTYVLAGLLGLSFATAHGSVTLVWPPTGLATAVLLLFGYRMVPGIALGAAIVNLLSGASAGFALATAFGNPLQAILCVWLLEKSGFRPLRLERVRHVVAFLLAATLSSVASALSGVIALCLSGMAQWSAAFELAWIWWMGDVIGVMVVAPAVIAWMRRQGPGVVFEGCTRVAAILGVTVLISFCVFGGLLDQTTSRSLSFAVFPALIWAAMALELRAVTTALLLTVTISVWGAVRGTGPFVVGPLHDSLLLLHAYMSTLTITTLLLAAVVAERRQAGKQVQRYQRTLEKQVATRTADLEHEVSNRRHTEEELRESEARFKEVAAMTSDWIWETDQSLRFTFVSRPLVEVFGDCASGVDSYRDLVDRLELPGGDRDEHLAALRAGQGFRDLHYCTGPPGGLESLHILASGLPIHASDGTVTGYRGAARDITAEIEAAVLAQRQERMSVLGRLTATVSHELRNPIATISSSVELLERVLPAGDERVTKALERIARGVTRCTSIIEELLPYARPGELYKQPVRLDEWLRETIQELDLDEKIEVELDLGTGVTVPLDPDRMRQAVVNVVQNACQALPPDAGVDRPKVVVATRTSEGRVAIRVEDNGRGMDASVLHHIFDPMFTTKPHGIGLGLPLVKQILEGHGGDVDVKSERGSGTVVTLWLPV